MRTLLLAADNDVFLAVAVFCLVVAFGILASTTIKKRIDQSQSGTKGAQYGGKIKVKLYQPFIEGESFAFYNTLQKALPLEYIVFPNVGVDTILKPAGSLVAFKEIANRYLDFVIFKKNGMMPVAVVDLIDPSISLTGITKQHEAITDSLKSISMPVLEFSVQDNYKEEDILSYFLDSQDPYTIAMLKKGKSVKKYSEDEYDNNQY
jgi:hypothetical protein